jgi:hypothetical protein
MPASPTTTIAPAATATKALLACGVVAGPLFLVTVLLQAFTRDGFDPARHLLSLLSLGDDGWIQVANFVVAGLLVVASAFGVARVVRAGRGATWLPRLVAVYGISLVWGGVFIADPADGYPAGTPDGLPESMSWHGTLHAFAAPVMGIALVAACIVFARRFAAHGHRAWSVYCLGSGAAFVVLGVMAFSVEDYRLMLAGGATIWIWASVMAARLLAEVTDGTRHVDAQPRM